MSTTTSARKQRALDLCREYLMPARVAAWENLGIPLLIGHALADRVRSAHDWKTTMSQFAVMYGDRFTAVRA